LEEWRQVRWPWKDGMKDGHGVFTWRNGDRWEGLFRADALLEGTLTRKQE